MRGATSGAESGCMTYTNQISYDAELAYRQQSIRRATAADRLARRVKRRRPRRMDSIHN